MVKIRLRRMGAKKAPFYRIVVADSRYPRDGRFIEEIGTYNPVVNPAELKVDVDRAQAWIKTGAQPTETVRDLLKKSAEKGRRNLRLEVCTMKELLTYVARNLVDHPEQVSVNEIQSDGETILELRVAPEDTGKVIGRQGRIAKEIRTLIRSVAQRSGKRVSVEIVD